MVSDIAGAIFLDRAPYTHTTYTLHGYRIPDAEIGSTNTASAAGTPNLINAHAYECSIIK